MDIKTKLIARRIIVICGWCREGFETDPRALKDGTYEPKICPHCGRRVRSSRIESTGNIVGRKHIHFQLREGDVV